MAHVQKVENAIERGKMPNMSVAACSATSGCAQRGSQEDSVQDGHLPATSYHGAQIFECYGLGPELIDTAFKGTVSRVGGLHMDELAAETSMFAADNFPGEEMMANVAARGMFQVKPDSSTTPTTRRCPSSCTRRSTSAVRATVLRRVQAVRGAPQRRPAASLRDMLEIVSDREPIDVEEVESVADICSASAPVACPSAPSLASATGDRHRREPHRRSLQLWRGWRGSPAQHPHRRRGRRGQLETFPHLRGLKNGDVATSAIRQVASGVSASPPPSSWAPINSS